jgi:hypothetical protein
MRAVAGAASERESGGGPLGPRTAAAHWACPRHPRRRAPDPGLSVDPRAGRRDAALPEVLQQSLNNHTVFICQKLNSVGYVVPHLNMILDQGRNVTFV